MTEQMAKELAAILVGIPAYPMPGSRGWGVLAGCSNGRFVAIEDGTGWAYLSREAFDSYHETGETTGLVDSREWQEWGEGEDWADGLASLLGSGESWQSGGNIWLVLYPRPDGKFAVIGSDSGAIYASREEFEADEYGQKAESHIFV
jgi:hypothetical protein